MQKQTVSAFIAGIMFSAGLLLAGMANPAKVLAFLDLAGQWDPSLMLVMAGAVAVATLGFRIAGTRTRAIFGNPMQIPTRRDIDSRLVLGSLGFGVGWGLAGFCPGPALVALGALQTKGLVFVLAMIAGMALFERIEQRRTVSA